MGAHPHKEFERRVLILAPTGRDATLARGVLEKAGIASLITRDAAALLAATEHGSGCILVAEEAIVPEVRRTLIGLTANQAPWSDLPILVMTRTGAGSGTVTDATENLGNVTLLDRPLRIATLLSAVRVALRARERQYELRERFEASELLAAIVTSSDDAIIGKSLDGTILSWNRGAEQIFGYSAEEAIGQNITLLIPVERRDEERQIIQRLLRGERIHHFETVRITKRGKPIDVSLTISPMRDASHKIIGASKVARDITLQKRAEQALRDADRRKDEFLATLAHELRNPLAPIHNSLHVLALAAGSNPALQRVHEMLERQVNHMIRLVDDLLEVSRITRGKIVLRKERSDLATIIRSAMEASQPLIESAGHELIVSLPEEPLTTLADPVRLAQVFANLLNNAAKYTPDSGTIWLTLRRQGSEAEVSIRDSGVGIPQEMLPRIFEIFTQLDISHRRSQGGLGIGLTLVQSLVEMHEGTVSAHSDGIGKGSEFTVRLPLLAGVVVPPPPLTEFPQATTPLRVLVVDDNRDAADSLGVLLDALGAEVRVVHDGYAALHALEQQKSSLVFLDLGMPGIDGFEVARRIRGDRRQDDITLVALTGWGQEEDRRRSRAAGFNYHLIKPTDIRELRTLMASVSSAA